MKIYSLVIIFLLSASLAGAADPIRVIIFGAHPDDCEYTSGGIAAMYSQMGHQVKFVSMTNGNKGHHAMTSAALGARRAEEAKDVARILGIKEYEIMDNDDGELTPSLANRFAVIKMICDWEADIVITHRPNDYHPDHRYASTLVQDAAYMISVPHMIPTGDALRKPVVFLYMPDHFQKPNPFSPDIVIDVTSVFDKKLEAVCANVSQFFEWMPWNEGYENEVPAEQAQKLKTVENRYMAWSKVDNYKKAALNWYSSAQLKNTRYVEAFEICEYSYIPNKNEIKKLFPMLP